MKHQLSFILHYPAAVIIIILWPDYYFFYLNSVFIFLHILCSFNAPVFLIERAIIMMFHFIHWLAVAASIKTEALVLAYQALQTMGPLYTPPTALNAAAIFHLALFSPRTTWSSFHPDPTSTASWSGVTTPTTANIRLLHTSAVEELPHIPLSPRVILQKLSYICGLRWSVKQESSLSYIYLFSATLAPWLWGW